MDIESTGLGAIAGAVATAITGAVVKIMGTSSDRSNDRAAATAEWRELAAQARADLDRCSEHARVMDARIEEMRATVSDIECRYVALQIEHATCPARIAELENRLREIERQSDPPEVTE